MNFFKITILLFFLCLPILAFQSRSGPHEMDHFKNTIMKDMHFLKEEMYAMRKEVNALSKSFLELSQSCIKNVDGQQKKNSLENKCKPVPGSSAMLCENFAASS